MQLCVGRHGTSFYIPAFGDGTQTQWIDHLSILTAEFVDIMTVLHYIQNMYPVMADLCYLMICPSYWQRTKDAFIGRVI